MYIRVLVQYTRSPAYSLIICYFLWPLCQRHKFAAPVCELFTTKLREWDEQTRDGGRRASNK